MFGPAVRRRLLVVIAAIASFGPLSASAYGAGRFDWTWSGTTQIDQPVEQQTPWIDDGGPGLAWWPNDQSLWVNNTTGCVWDQDDHTSWTADGGLSAGVPVTTSFCQVAEPTSVYNTIWGTSGYWSFAARVVAISVRSSAPDLVVQACYQPGGCVKVPPTAEKRGYNYHGCVRLQYTDDDPAVAPVPGANGAVGVKTDVQVSVTSPKRASATGYVEEAGGFGDWSTYCSSQVAASAYPLKLFV